MSTMDTPATPPPSPTGTPTALGELLKNKYVAGVLALVIAAATTVQTMALAGQAHFPAWLVTAAGIVLGAGALLGLYSPGARAASVVVLLLCASLLLTSSCATLGATEKAQLVDCGEKGLATAATQLAPQLGGILAGDSPNWNADAGDLVMAAGSAAFCALEVVIAALEQGHLVTADIGGAGAGPASPTLVSADAALARAYAVKARLNYRVRQ